MRPAGPAYHGASTIGSWDVRDMTMRSRMLSIVQGRKPDRVPFVQYSGCAGPNDEIWDVVGREHMGLLSWVNVHRIETPHCRFVREEIVRDGRPGFRNTLHTPEGDLFEERLYEPTYGTSAAAGHYVKQPEDYAIFMAYLRDVQVTLDLEGLISTVGDLGEDGLPHVAVLRTPYQQLWVQWVDLTDLCAHLALEPDLMEEVAALMADVQRRVFDVVCRAVASGAPIPYVVFPDNITAPAIGCAYFREYCVTAYDELAGRLSETGKDVPVYVHMDGDLKALWDAIGSSGVRGLDSMSPPPDNDTRVADAVANWPVVRVGINFPSSVHLEEPHAIFEATARILEEGAHSGRLQIQISENVPPGVWRASFPEIVRAIQAFGAVSTRGG